MPRPPTLATPRISGAALRALRRSLVAAPTRKLIYALARRDLGMDTLAALEPELRGPQPLAARPLRARATHDRPSEGLPVAAPDAAAPTSASLVAAFRAGTRSPVETTRRALDAAARLAADRPAMPVLLERDEAGALAAAEASEARWRRGTALGPLDGVPVTVKEEVDVRGLYTRLGTTYVGDAPAREDGAVVERLRAAGAVVLGSSPMTEYGLTPLGFNPHRAMPRNPHHTGHVAGGSSTGAAVGVATGVVPVAVGSDGGGSIRVPASFCGVFGLKPTFGRISRRGDGFGGTMAHLGPLGRSAWDLAVFLEATAGEDPADELTHGAPRCEVVGALGRGVRGLRVGVLEEELRDADEAVARACEAALDALGKEGAVLVPLRAELLRAAPAIGYPTIGVESYAGLLDARRYHADAIGDDLAVSLSSLGELPADAYLDAQRLRARLRLDVAALLREVDVLALPTAARTATAVTDEELRGGFVDPPALGAACRFAFLANLTGLPAGTAPVGVDAAGLPIGLQIVGDAWDEACVLQVLAHLERARIAEVRRPRVFVG
jgi:aspartyl-tRNA(Asn)/glutamyl-tRNA(Gln) amidotransferase subunit A